MKKIIVLSLVVFSTMASGESIPGETLLNHFRSGCRTQGEWTRSALADSAALISTLNSMTTDPDCRSVGGAIAGLNTLSNQVIALQSMSNNQREIAKLDSQEQELLVQLSQLTDPDIQAELNSSLRNLQINRAALMGQNRFDRDLLSPGQASMMAGLVQVANSTFNQLASNQKCLDKNPGVINAATSIMATIGSAAVAVNPALGLGMTAASSFLGAVIDGLRINDNTRHIRQIADSTIALEAYQCALETMSDKLCQMRDAEAFLRFQSANRRPINSNLAAAIRLKDRELPALMEWLNKIKSGVPPTNTSEASRQNNILINQMLIRTSEGTGHATITQNEKLFENTPIEERWILLQTIVNQIIGVAGSSGNPNPFYQVVQTEYAPFFLLGRLPSDSSIRVYDSQNRPVGYHSLSSWTPPPDFQPRLDIVRTQFMNWVRKAEARVNAELAEVLQPDTVVTLSNANDPDNAWKISPMAALVNINNFLINNSPSDADPAFKKVFAQTLALLKEIQRITDEYISSNKKSSSGGEVIDIINIANPVEEIYRLAKLQYGTIVLQTRLDMIIRVSILKLLETSTAVDQVVVAQLLASDRFTTVLSRVSGTDDLGFIREDIERGQETTMENLNAFLEIFGKNINQTLARLKSEEKRGSPTVARSKRAARTRLCHLLMAVPQARFNIYTGYCEGLTMDSYLAGGFSTPAITADIFRSDIGERACVYRDFFRKNRIYDTWGIKL